MKKVIFAFIVNMLFIYSTCFAVNLPGVSEDKERNFGLWRVSVLNEDNLKFVQIYTGLTPNSTFRILFGNPDITFYQIMTSNPGIPHNSSEYGIIRVFVNGIANQVQCRIRSYGPWLTNFINLPASFINSLSKADSFGIQISPTYPPIVLNTMGFDSALKYAKELQKNLKPIPKSAIKFRPF